MVHQQEAGLAVVLSRVARLAIAYKALGVEAETRDAMLRKTIDTQPHEVSTLPWSLKGRESTFLVA
jgi:hypothetical protein